MAATYRLFLCLCIIFCLNAENVYSQVGSDWVDSDVYEFDSLGVWAWFQDERAVIDTTKNKLIVGSANKLSTVDISIFDIESKTMQDSMRSEKMAYGDPQNAPAVLIAPDGNYIAMWSHHYDKYFSRYRIFNGNEWLPEQRFNWETIPGGTNSSITYSNLCYLSKENRLYNFACANDRAPNFIFSDDSGKTWQYGGQLITGIDSVYTSGYFKYWSNGIDRIDLVFNESHPRDRGTSIYHGYIRERKLFTSEGNIVDDDIYDREKTAAHESFTKVFEHGTEVNGIHMGRCWQHDIARYADGTVAILFEARANNEIDDHRNFYARYNGTEWKVIYIGKAGWHLYGNEHDWVGLGALNPDDPYRIYISSQFNPGDDMQRRSEHRELWRGTTSDSGDTWEWEPVTANSMEDNIRPIVPKWKPGKEALLWCRGLFQTASTIYSKVIGTFYEYDPPQVITEVSKSHTGLPLTNSPDHITIKQHSGQLLFDSNSMHRSPFKVSVFSVSGKKVFANTGTNNRSGESMTTCNTRKLSAGIYYVQIISGSTRHIHRLSVCD